MKKKRKIKGRKSLTAVGAVVAAGLTPGIATGTPAPQEPIPDVEFTAADVVSINGEVFDFDELFAMREINRDPQDIRVVYGPPASIRQQEEKARQEAMREQARQDSILQEKMRQEKALQEAYRQDSIRRANEDRALVYGPPPPRYKSLNPEQLRDIALDNKEEAISLVMSLLMDYCSQMPRPESDVTSPEEINLIRDLKMNSQQLENLSELIEYHSGVQLTEDMLKQLGTPLRIASFIVEVATPIKKD